MGRKVPHRRGHPWRTVHGGDHAVRRGDLRGAEWMRHRHHVGTVADEWAIGMMMTMMLGGEKWSRWWWTDWRRTATVLITGR